METTVYIPTAISEELPPVANENYITISEKGIKTSRFFNGNRFETAHYDGIITHWLKPISLSTLIENERKCIKESIDAFCESVRNNKNISNAHKQVAYSVISSIKISI
jgi:hypothetical protein